MGGNDLATLQSSADLYNFNVRYLTAGLFGYFLIALELYTHNNQQSGHDNVTVSLAKFNKNIVLT